MLTLHNASKHFGDLPALASTDLSFPAGRTTVLLGPSGCGKSTLLRLLIGLVRPTTGRVTFDGEEVAPENAARVRRRMGFVIQEGGLFPHLTAERNVSLMARHLGWEEGRVAGRIRSLVELTHFPADGLARYPAQLSGGQRQRVSLMRALMLDPDVLLLDEPLGALDPMIRADLQVDLREIFQTLGKTVVMVTHDIGEAGFFSDTIVLMRDGHVVQRGTLEDLVVSPVDPFVTQFINAQRSPLDSLGRS